MVRHIEQTSELLGRPRKLEAHPVRELLRELRRQKAMRNGLRRPPHTLWECAACYPMMAVLVMDGNFKLFRYKRAFARWRRSVYGEPGSPGSLFFSKEGAEAICLECKESTERTCGPAEIDALGGKTHAAERLMEPSACFMGGCAHRMLMGAIDFSGGEKAGLSVAMCACVPRQRPHPDAPRRKVHVVCSDTMCRVHKALGRAQEKYGEDGGELPAACGDGFHWPDLEGCQYCVNALHVRGVRARARAATTCVRTPTRVVIPAATELDS